MQNKKYNRVTYEELSNDLSHYEISYLATFKAIDIIKSGVSLINNSPYKPKVALVALNELCNDLSATLAYKEEIKDRLFNTEEIDSVDEYNIDNSTEDEEIETKVDNISDIENDDNGLSSDEETVSLISEKFNVDSDNDSDNGLTYDDNEEK